MPDANQDPQIFEDLLDNGPMIFETNSEARRFIKEKVVRYHVDRLVLKPAMLEALQRGEVVVFDIAHGEYAAIVELEK